MSGDKWSDRSSFLIPFLACRCCLLAFLACRYGISGSSRGSCRFCLPPAHRSRGLPSVRKKEVKKKEWTTSSADRVVNACFWFFASPLCTSTALFFVFFFFIYTLVSSPLFTLLLTPNYPLCSFILPKKTAAPFHSPSHPSHNLPYPMRSVSAPAPYGPQPSTVDPFAYQPGFGNRFASEALPDVLPRGLNCPQKVKYDLYSEQLNGSGFVSPRAQLHNVWMYRIRPAVAHGLLRPQPDMNPLVCFHNSFRAIWTQASRKTLKQIANPPSDRIRLHPPKPKSRFPPLPGSMEPLSASTAFYAHRLCPGNPLDCRPGRPVP